MPNKLGDVFSAHCMAEKHYLNLTFIVHVFKTTFQGASFLEHTKHEEEALLFVYLKIIYHRDYLYCVEKWVVF